MTYMTPCFGHTHRQGRSCECDAQASRDSLAPLLWQRTGGARVSNGTGFHFELEGDEAADIAPETADSATEYVVAAVKVGFVLALLIAAGLWSYFCPGGRCW